MKIAREIWVVLALGLAALFVSACAPGKPRYENIVPERVNSSSGILLRGWEEQPKPYASKRIMLDEGGYSHARMLVFHTPELDAATRPSKFRKSVRQALMLEGVRNVRFVNIRTPKGKIVDQFRKMRGAPDATFRVWVITGDSNAGKVKAIGVSIITAKAANPGTSVEVFIAPVKEYERLGGYAVPAVGLFRTLRLEPGTNMRKFGQASDREATKELENYLIAMMAMSLDADVMQDIVDGQTLRIIMGLDQVVPYGLQDPIYDWGN